MADLATADDPTALDATAMAAAVQSGAIGAEALLDAHLARVRRWNPSLAAIVASDEQAARAAARACDADAAHGAWRGPLHGLPMTVKDAWNVAGLPATVGTPWLRNHRPVRDATAVARLRAAGAVVWGKSNLPLASYDWQCASGFLPRGRNPWSLAHGPGGSSGGAAAAVAARFTPLELGSDVAGSIRVPAHACGVVGLRPGEDVVPLDGHGDVPGSVHALRHLLVGGPLARSVRDLRLAMRVLTARDDDWVARPCAAAGLRLAITAEAGPHRADADTRRVLTEAVATLRAAGASVTAVEPPLDLEALFVAWGAIQGFELRAAMPGRVAALPGAGIAGAALFRLVFGPGTFSRGLGRGWSASPRTYFAALDARDAALAAFDAFAARWDAWLTPVGLAPALAHQRTGRAVPVDGVRVPYGEVFGRWCCPTAVTAHPVVVLPAGRSSAGLPIGVQVHGRRGHDAALLDVAEAIAGCLPALGMPDLAATMGS